MTDHINEISYPPFQIGQRVKIKEDGPGGEVHRVLGARYEHRMVPSQGWDFHVVPEDGIETGNGGYDGFGPNDLEPA